MIRKVALLLFSFKYLALNSGVIFVGLYIPRCNQMKEVCTVSVSCLELRESE